MSNKIDIKTLKALQQGSHKAFEEVFITVRRKPLYMATLSRIRMLRSLQKIYL